MHSPTEAGVAAAASPAVLSPIAASVPMGDQLSTSPAPAEDKQSRLYAIIQERQEREGEMFSEQKDLVFVGERFYFFDLSNAFSLAQMGFHGAEVVQEIQEATALIFTRKDVNKYYLQSYSQIFKIHIIYIIIHSNYSQLYPNYIQIRFKIQ